jgi:hypothetical protein
MDVGRDLVDRQLLDREGRQCGRVDDLLIEWDQYGARLGLLLSGPAAILDQFGWPGRLGQRAAGARARRMRCVSWASVTRVDRGAVTLAVAATDLVAAAAPEPPASGCTYSTLDRLAVLDSAGERRGVLDLRAEATHGGTAPAILGLIACRRTWVRTLGMKRYDADGVPLSDVAGHSRFVPWDVIDHIDREIRLSVAFAELPRLAEAPDPGPPPLPERS